MRLCNYCATKGTCIWEASGRREPRICPVLPEPSSKRVDIDAMVSNACDRLGQVAIVATHFNPCRYHRLCRTYYEWLPTLGPLAQALRVYELVLDDDEAEIEGSIEIRGRRELHGLWQKESLINRAIRDCGSDIKYVAWVDHDFVNSDPDWLRHALDLLDRGAVAVQLFDRAVYLTPDRFIEGANPGRMFQWRINRSWRGNPGGNWIADVNFLRSTGGLNAANIVGGGDQTWFDAMIGQVGPHLSDYNTSLANHLLDWTLEAIAKRGKRRATYLPATLYHLHHGNRINRRYNERYAPLAKHNFDPNIDVRVNSDGLLEWCSDKPELHRDVANYFADRLEDDA